jgi:hypothetical protein
MKNLVCTLCLAGAALWGILPCSRAKAEVSVLQQGLSPTTEYRACADTWISDEAWEKGRNNGRSPTLQSGGKRHILLRFDLAPLPKDAKIHQAVLRLADAGYPRRDKDGKFPSSMKAYILTRPWQDDANWLEYKRGDKEKKIVGEKWAAGGGEYDAQTDFGQGPTGLVAVDTIFDGPWGHVHEFDVTEAVRRWHEGKLPNHGFLLAGNGLVASSEWAVPGARPKLLVDHGPAPAGIPRLQAAPREIELDPRAQTADSGTAQGEHAVVRVGQNANCALRGQSNDAYVKESPEYPGNWGWMTEHRVGGVAGAMDRALLYFDLSQLPPKASVKQARLVCSFVGNCAQARNYRYGTFLLKLPEAPGWSADEVTSALRRSGTPWPQGGILACSASKPLAIGKVFQADGEEHGQKRKIDAGLEFDLTGVVRAWLSGAVPNCGIVLDNRLEGGQYDIYSSRAWQVEKRPYLEIVVSPGADQKPQPPAIDKSTPRGDYWVAPMREVHQRFKGKPGTLAQYGDSITIANPFLGEYGWAKKIEPKNCAPDVKAECELVQKHADLGLWVKWKGIGNTGMTTSDWLRTGVDGWQKQLNPEAAVIMFGTNDGMTAPQYAENIASACRRMMADGTVPLLTSPPPKPGQTKEPYRLACVTAAKALKIPLIDFQGEILRRRPNDWDGQLPQFKEYKTYQQPTLMADSHPSYPKPWINDFSEEGLNKNGYNLRNYMTIRAYAEVIAKVFQGRP